MWAATPKLVFVAALAINCILWSHSRYAQVGLRSPFHSGLAKRSLGDADRSPFLWFSADEECHPLAVPPEEQCAHVREVCAMDRTFLNIGYLDAYFCAPAGSLARPALFTTYALWLVFLFSTLGISASDFFCPNLATIARLLGLDENVAGVTLLAFGNGSPDMFATFSAMRAGSGGLAIGELLGAAAFIVSVVVGAMCVIKPFRVARGPFLRDVGFFTVAVALLLVVLWDNKLEAWEAAGMIVLYAVYVCTVVVGSWWRRRQEARRRYEVLVRSEYAEDAPYHDDQPYFDEPDASPHADTLQVPSPFARSRALSHPEPPRNGLQLQTDLPARPRTRSSSPSTAYPSAHSSSHPHSPSQMPSFSLVGALEFRRVVAALQRDAASPSLARFDHSAAVSPLSPYASYARRSRRGTTSGSRSPLRSPSFLERERDPWDAALARTLPRVEPELVVLTEPAGDAEGPASIPIPVISRTPASPTSTDSPSSESESPRADDVHAHAHASEKPSRLKRAARVLFPTLRGLGAKPALSKLVAVLAAPAVLALTLTLPVVVTADEDAAAGAEKRAERPVELELGLGMERSTGPAAGEARLVEFEEEGAGVERALLAEAEEEVEEEMHELVFHKWLMAAQCCLGPLFCAAVLFDGVRYEGWLLLAAGAAGFAAAVLVAVFAKTGRSRASQLARCAMGFVVAVVWIMAIADEVVKVLQTFGFIFGLSDAIIGITIFAIGNSLADLVANMSVAVFAPIMGFSACFGGPMLNILLGVGVSGSYIVRQTGAPYPLRFSPALVVTGGGLLALLLATLAFVPFNGYFLPRAWGVALVAAYLCIMLTNIVVEIKGFS